MRFLKKVEEKARRFHEVEKLLQDPSVTADPKRVKELGKEFRILEKMAVLYRDYLKMDADTDAYTRLQFLTTELKKKNLL